MTIRILSSGFLALALALMGYLGLAETAHASACLAPRENQPKIALVLGGGGARGTAHIGVIRALEELRVPVDYIAGTSMGALLGGMMATGLSADELEKVAAAIDWDDTFTDDAPRRDRPFRRKRDEDLGLYAAKIGLSPSGTKLPRGAIAGQKVLFLIESTVGSRAQTEDFDALPIPFRAVASDILTADVVVMDSGNLATAMRSSMSLPAVFDPVDTGDQLLVDGGILMNLPVSVGKDMGADIIIAVDVGEPLMPKENVQNIVQILYQLTGVVTIVNSRQQKALLGADDFLVQPELGPEIGSSNFAAALDAIPIGYEAAMQNRDRLASLSMTEAQWQDRQKRIAACVDDTPVIDFVRLRNSSRFSDEVILKRIETETGDLLDNAVLEKDIERIYALGFMQSVQYRLVTEGPQTGIEFDVLPDSRGGDFFEYGFGIRSSERNTTFDLRFAYLKTNIGELGTEFRGMLHFGQGFGVLTELYRPLGTSLKYFLLPRVIYDESLINTFDDVGNTVQQFRVAQAIAEISIGREFSNVAALFTGLRFGPGDIDVQIGNPNFQKIEFDRGEYRLGFTYDSQDNRFFPGEGSLFRIEWRKSDEALGASSNYEQLTSQLLTARSFGNHSLQAGFEFDTSSDDVIPVQDLFRAGGFPRMSGFQRGELVGEHFGMLIAGYRYQLVENKWFPVFVGGTLEYGNAASSRNDVFGEGIVSGSAYLGFDSIIGPMYLGMGFAEGGRRLTFLSIGTVYTDSSLVQ